MKPALAVEGTSVMHAGEIMALSALIVALTGLIAELRQWWKARKDDRESRSIDKT